MSPITRQGLEEEMNHLCERNFFSDVIALRAVADLFIKVVNSGNSGMFGTVYIYGGRISRQRPSEMYHKRTPRNTLNNAINKKKAFRKH